MDKDVLMKQLVQLRQQRQANDHQLQTVGQHVQVMEKWQQQMMLFLAKAMRSPSFLARLVQQQNESNRRISGGNKKRRLPNQEDGGNSVCKLGNASPNGQIVKYQPLVNKAAKAMLRQILKVNASPRFESTINSPHGFLIDNGPSAPSHALDRSGSTSQVLGVNLSEVLPFSLQSSLATEFGMPVSCPWAAVAESQSSPSVAFVPAKVAEFPEMSINLQEDKVLPDFSQVQGMVLESTVEASDLNFEVSETGNLGCTGSISGFIDESMLVLNDKFSSDPDVDIMLDEIPKLPGINDVFSE